LIEERGFTGSYSSVKRFLRRIAPPSVRATLRLEVPPGEEAQVNFGFAGQFLDPERGRVRRVWVFVMTLSFSRHQYAELVLDQTVETWLRLHRAAFEFFGGVPRRIVLDNLRAAIVHASLHDPGRMVESLLGKREVCRAPSLVIIVGHAQHWFRQKSLA
jgi:transposase